MKEGGPGEGLSQRSYVAVGVMVTEVVNLPNCHRCQKHKGSKVNARYTSAIALQKMNSTGNVT